MAREATLSVSLTKQLKSYVSQKVSSGQYESASEVIRHGLRVLQDQERRESSFWPEVRQKLREARKAIASGDVVEGAAFMKSRIDALNRRDAKGSKRRA
jgi:antitoxin ParD1/3/4